jgi:hypothetical protein
MASTITIGSTELSEINVNNLYRQGVEVTSIQYLRGAQFPKILANETPGLIRSGSLQATFDVRFYDDTLNEPIAGSLTSLSLDTPRVTTKIRHQQERRDLGQISATDTDLDAPGLLPFTENEKFDAKKYVEAGNNRFSLGISAGNVNVKSPYYFDGVLEPFDIRSIATFSSIETPQPAHGIYGSLEGSYAKDAFNRFNPIGFVLEFNGPSCAPFLDAGQTVLTDSVSSFPDPGYIDTEGTAISPYTDSSDRSAMSKRYRDTQIGELISLNSTSLQDYMPAFNEIIATAGIQTNPTHLNRDQIPGTDSIAFVGLRR